MTVLLQDCGLKNNEKTKAEMAVWHRAVLTKGVAQLFCAFSHCVVISQHKTTDEHRWL